MFSFKTATSFMVFDVSEHAPKMKQTAILIDLDNTDVFMNVPMMQNAENQNLIGYHAPHNHGMNDINQFSLYEKNGHGESRCSGCPNPNFESISLNPVNKKVLNFKYAKKNDRRKRSIHGRCSN